MVAAAERVKKANAERAAVVEGEERDVARATAGEGAVVTAREVLIAQVLCGQAPLSNTSRPLLIFRLLERLVEIGWSIARLNVILGCQFCYVATVTVRSRRRLQDALRQIKNE